MITTKDPVRCPSCGGKNVYLAGRDFKKDVWGEDTEEVISGTWFCRDCGEPMGRKISRYDNDIHEKSI
nr:hypothetical protein [uncultured Clostridium sp.]